MKSRALSLSLSISLIACTAGGATWSSDVCGCIDAWESLAYQLKLPERTEADDMTQSVVLEASKKLIGTQFKLSSLPNTGSVNSCKETPVGATCEWKLWTLNGARKGYIADFGVSGDGKITTVSVNERVWAATSGA